MTKHQKTRLSPGFINGAKRIRTADPLHAMQVLYQLSYGPKKRWNCPRANRRR